MAKKNNRKQVNQKATKSYKAECERLKRVHTEENKWLAMIAPDSVPPLVLPTFEQFKSQYFLDGYYGV